MKSGLFVAGGALKARVCVRACESHARFSHTKSTFTVEGGCVKVACRLREGCVKADVGPDVGASADPQIRVRDGVDCGGPGRATHGDETASCGRRIQHTTPAPRAEPQAPPQYQHRLRITLTLRAGRDAANPQRHCTTWLERGVPTLDTLTPTNPLSQQHLPQTETIYYTRRQYPHTHQPSPNDPSPNRLLSQLTPPSKRAG